MTCSIHCIDCIVSQSREVSENNTMHCLLVPFKELYNNGAIHSVCETLGCSRNIRVKMSTFDTANVFDIDIFFIDTVINFVNVRVQMMTAIDSL